MNFKTGDCTVAEHVGSRGWKPFPDLKERMLILVCALVLVKGTAFSYWLVFQYDLDLFDIDICIVGKEE